MATLRRLLLGSHRWAGMILIPYVVLVGGTGAILVFKQEFQRAAHPEFFAQAAPDAGLADPALVLENLRNAYPGFRITSLTWPTAARGTFLAYPSRNGDTRTAFAHAVSGTVLGELPRRSGVEWVREFHVYLFGGLPGLRVHGVLSGALALTTLAGGVLWWLLPGRRYPGGRSGASERTSARRIHRAVGSATLGAVVMWSLTGVYFAYPAHFRAAVNAVTPITVRQAPASRVPSGAHVARADPRALVASAMAAVPGGRVVRYVLPSGVSGSATIVLATANPADSDTSDEISCFFDQYTGELLETRPQRRTTVGDHLMPWLLPVHAGRFETPLLRIAWSGLALSLPLLALTGWIMRRPRRNTAASSRAAHTGVPLPLG
ncbi:MAG: PepSY-associated TM helix domain-containing protein [Vicinamibacterales bacterium]